MKKKVVITLTNGQEENLYPQNESQFQKLVDDLEKGNLIYISTSSGSTKTLKPQSIQSWEFYNIQEKENSKRRHISEDGLYETIDGRVYPTKKLIELVEKKMKKK